MSEIALVADSGGDRDRSLQSFSTALRNLELWFDDSTVGEGYKAVGSHAPFYLAYHDQNNRNLLAQYGDLCARLMNHWFQSQGIAVARNERHEVVRVGIVSAHLRDHSVWTAITKGWCLRLNPATVSMHLFHTGSRRDGETALAESRAERFVAGPLDLKQWVNEIVSSRPDVLIYPEIGMDPTTIRLASLRLAPVQIAAWGHPETTGLPTIDYYLSAEGFEPRGSVHYYREKLVSLPHLGCCYLPLETPTILPDVSAFGIDFDRPIAVCAGTPYKYAPEHDGVLVDIARRVRDCQFVFFLDDHQNLSDRLRDRLEIAFERANLYFPDHAAFVPWQTRPAFLGLLERSALLLDTIGFSGFNTAMQAMECGLPIVSREGAFMRGRFGSAILRRLGLPELIAQTDAEYSDIAVRVLRDDEYRNAVRTRIVGARDVLFGDVAPVLALEQFLGELVR